MAGSSSLVSSVPTSFFSCQTDSEMELSEASHFSVLDESATSSNWSPEANYEYFDELKNHPQWGDFFLSWGQTIRLGNKISHGAQADIYEARTGEDGEFNLVVKVMKGDVPLQAFQAQWPTGLLSSRFNSIQTAYDMSLFNSIETRCDLPLFNSIPTGYNLPSLFNILGGILLEEERLRGRFAFVMFRQWGDLRLLIDRRIKARRSIDGPFSIDQAIHLMLTIAKDMDILHTKHNIVHRDLKASNVLVRSRNSHGEMIGDEGMVIDDELLNVIVADFESSRLVMGTAFWRAPEIFQQLENRVPSAEVTFTSMVDVYSYGMTCYEIVTGRIPFDSEHEPCTWDEVLSGRRPTIPKKVPMFLRNIIKSCWHPDPLERPNFHEIVKLLKYKPKIPNLLECRQSYPTSVVIDNKIHESATIIKVEQWRHCMSLTLLQVMEDLALQNVLTLRATTTHLCEKVVYNLEVGDYKGVKLEGPTVLTHLERALRRNLRKIFDLNGRFIQTDDDTKPTYVLEITSYDLDFHKFLEVCCEVDLLVLKAKTWVHNGCLHYAMLVHNKKGCCVDSLLKGMTSRWVSYFGFYIVFHKLVTGDVDIILQNFKRVMASFCPVGCPFQEALFRSPHKGYLPLKEGNIRHTAAIDVLRQSGYCSGSSFTQWNNTSWLLSRPQHDKDLVKFRGLPLFFMITNYDGVTSICLRRMALQRISGDYFHQSGGV